MASFPYAVDTDPRGVVAATECFLLDLDGTLYLGGRWIDGALEFLSRIRETGRRWRFMTNNSSRSTAQYIEKLAGMGLAVCAKDILSSGAAMAELLAREYAGKTVCLLGNRALASDFEAAGIPLRFSADADIAVAAFDTELTWQKLCVFCDAVRSGKPFFATHPDLNCPTENGFVPDLGSFLALIEASTGRRPDRIAGKPYADFADYAVRAACCPRARCTVVGDRLYTDVKAGASNGMGSVLVLSGEATLDDLAAGDVAPDAVFRSVRELTAFL